MNALIEARLRRGLSRNQAAQQIGVHRRTLEKLEGGQEIHPELALKIARFYGLEVVDIWPVGQAA